MLILRRKMGEKLIIGENITVTVVDIYEGGVRLAIDVPKSVSILRSELLEAVDANRDAMGGQPQKLLSALNKGPKKEEEAKNENT